VIAGGEWDGRQIVSREYLEASFEPGELAENYGYLWWLVQGDPQMVGVAALGYLSTDMYVYPDYDLVVVRMQAPVAGYTGENEAEGYTQRAASAVLRAVVGLIDPDDAWRELPGLP
jgi:hypothetical protein